MYEVGEKASLEAAGSGSEFGPGTGDVLYRQAALGTGLARRLSPSPGLNGCEEPWASAWPRADDLGSSGQLWRPGPARGPPSGPASWWLGHDPSWLGSLIGLGDRAHLPMGPSPGPELMASEPVIEWENPPQAVW